MSHQPILLRNSYVQELRRENTDFQAQMHQFGVHVPDDRTRTDCIVVATIRDDFEVSELSWVLAQRGVRLVRIDADALHEGELPTVDTSGDVRIGNELLSPKLFWLRHSADLALQTDEAARKYHQVARSSLINGALRG